MHHHVKNLHVRVREGTQKEGGREQDLIWPSGFLYPLPAQYVRVFNKAPANSLAVRRKPWFHNCFVFSLSLFSLSEVPLLKQKKKGARKGGVGDKHRDRGKEGREGEGTAKGLRKEVQRHEVK